MTKHSEVVPCGGSGKDSTDEYCQLGTYSNAGQAQDIPNIFFQTTKVWDIMDYFFEDDG